MDTKDFGAGLRITPRKCLLIYIALVAGLLWWLTMMMLRIALFARDDRCYWIDSNLTVIVLGVFEFGVLGPWCHDSVSSIYVGAYTRHVFAHSLSGRVVEGENCCFTFYK